MKLTEEQLRPKVITGEGYINKTLYYKSTGSSCCAQVVTIQKGNFDNLPDEEIAMLGQSYVNILDAENRSIKSSIRCESVVENEQKESDCKFSPAMNHQRVS